MKATKWLYALLIICTLTSCGTMISAINMDSRMKKIELGMSKKKVISILGSNYEQAGARMTSDGSMESISYYAVSTTEAYYILTFKDGELVEWFKEKAPQQKQHNHH